MKASIYVILGLWFSCYYSSLWGQQRPFATDKLIVAYKTHQYDQYDQADWLVDTRVLAKKQLSQTPIVIYHLQTTKDRVKDSLNILKLLAKASQQAEIAWVELDYEVAATFFPNDSAFQQQALWSLENTGQNGGKSGADIAATEAWELVQGDTTKIVGILDSGIDYEHPDLLNNIWTNPGEIPNNGLDDDANGYIDDVHGWDFVNEDADPMDDHGHGTHVAGILGAEGDNTIGTVGVAWYAKMMALKFLDRHGRGHLSDAIEAIVYARTMGVSILNISWGSNYFSRSLLSVLEAETQEMLLVAAAGNLSQNNDIQPFYPASYELPNLISVAATDKRDELAGFSNSGAFRVDIAAPGVGIWSSLPDNRYGFRSGTSMAAPLVSGAALLTWAQFRHFSPEEIKSRILAATDRLESLRGKASTGGRLNLFRAVNILTFERAYLADTLAIIHAAPTKDNGYILTGSRRIEGKNSMHLTKTDELGQTLWTRQYAAAQAGRFVIAAIDEGFFVLASKTDTVSRQAFGTYADSLYVLKVDEQGEVLWARTIGITYFNLLRQIIPQAHGGCIVGSTRHLEGHNLGPYMVELDAEGNTMREKLWDQVPANRSEQLFHFIALPVGGYMMVGGVIEGFGQSWNSVVTRLDENWNVLWNRRYIADGTNLFTYILPSKEGDGYLMLGYREVAGNRLHSFLVKINDRGNTQWQREYIAEVDSFALMAVYFILAGYEDNYLLGGFSVYGSTFISVDLEGNPLWGKYVDNTNITHFVSAVANPAEGDYAFSIVNRAGTDSRLIKASNDFEFCSEKEFDFSSIDPQLPVNSLLFQEVEVSILASPPIGSWDSQIQDSLICEAGLNECTISARFVAERGESCIGGSISFSNASLRAASYEWQINGESLSTEEDLIHVFTEAGSDTLRLIATALSGCRDTVEQIIEVLGMPEIDLGADSAICAPVVVLNIERKDYFYRWYELSQADVLLDSAASISLRNSGAYRLEVEDVCGSIAMDTIIVQLNGNCVWPGDVDANGQVDALDFLALARAQGRTGPERINASSEWKAQIATDWAENFVIPEGINMKRADCNGDGYTDMELDSMVITQNWGTVGHQVEAETEAEGWSIRIEAESDSIVFTGMQDTIWFDILVGDEQNPLTAYGMAASLYLDRVFQVQPIIDIQDSWLGVANVETKLITHIQNPKQMDFAFSRIDGMDELGKGRIGRGGLIVQVEDIADTIRMADFTFISLSISNTVLTDHLGIRLPTKLISSSQTASVKIDLRNIDLSRPSDLGEDMLVYPNPSHSSLWVKTEKPFDYQLINGQGQVVLKGRKFDSSQAIDVSQLSRGIYVLQLRGIQGYWFRSRKVWLR